MLPAPRIGVEVRRVRRELFHKLSNAREGGLPNYCVNGTAVMRPRTISVMAVTVVVMEAMVFAGGRFCFLEV